MPFPPLPPLIFVVAMVGVDISGDVSTLVSSHKHLYGLIVSRHFFKMCSLLDQDNATCMV
jgi:hypothetical protein